MARATPLDRAALDQYIKELAQIGDGLTLEEFRSRSIARARRIEARVRFILYGAGLVFMAAMLAELIFYRSYPPNGLLWIVVWAMAMGGLGAIASIFLHILRLMPQEAMQQAEEMHVLGRIFLGCLFSLILGLTLVPDALLDFFRYLGNPQQVGPRGGGAKLLLPFLCGYSIPLVLGLLGKAIQAVEITIGMDDRRPNRVVRVPRRRP